MKKKIYVHFRLIDILIDQERIESKKFVWFFGN